MAIIDILIAIAILISIIVGYVRGIIKEGLSVAALVIAIWAALYFGPAVGDLADSWLESEGMQVWFGRILVFSILLSLGGLLSWGLSKIIRLSALSNLDRVAGCLFGAARAVLLVAVFVLAGRYTGFSGDDWWRDSQLIPHFETVAEWVEEMAPRGLDAITPDEVSDKLPMEISEVFD
jgi:membrane protein required for colicin V production